MPEKKQKPPRIAPIIETSRRGDRVVGNVDVRTGKQLDGEKTEKPKKKNPGEP